MMKIETGILVANVRELLSKAELMSKMNLEDKGVVKSLKSKATELARNLKQLDPQALEEEDKKRLAQLGQLSIFQENAPYLQAAARFLSSSTVGAIGKFAETDTRKNTSPVATTGALNPSTATQLPDNKVVPLVDGKRELATMEKNRARVEEKAEDQIDKILQPDELPPGVVKLVKVFIAKT